MNNEHIHPKFERTTNKHNIEEVTKKVKPRLNDSTMLSVEAILERRIGSFFIIDMSNEEIKALTNQFLKDFMTLGMTQGPLDINSLENIPDEFINQYLINKYGDKIVLKEDNNDNLHR